MPTKVTHKRHLKTRPPQRRSGLDQVFDSPQESGASACSEMHGRRPVSSNKDHCWLGEHAMLDPQFLWVLQDM